MYINQLVLALRVPKDHIKESVKKIDDFLEAKLTLPQMVDLSLIVPNPPFIQSTITTLDGITIGDDVSHLEVIFKARDNELKSFVLCKAEVTKEKLIDEINKDISNLSTSPIVIIASVIPSRQKMEKANREVYLISYSPNTPIITKRGQNGG